MLRGTSNAPDEDCVVVVDGEDDFFVLRSTGKGHGGLAPSLCLLLFERLFLLWCSLDRIGLPGKLVSKKVGEGRGFVLGPGYRVG